MKIVLMQWQKLRLSLLGQTHRRRQDRSELGVWSEGGQERRLRLEEPAQRREEPFNHPHQGQRKFGWFENGFFRPNAKRTKNQPTGNLINEKFNINAIICILRQKKTNDFFQP
jgi:hypothetical protein